MRIPHYRVALVRDGSHAVASRTINHPQDVYSLLRDELANADREIFLALLLDTRNRVIGTHQVSVGSLSASIVHPRETFKAAILGNAASMILTHNHPSGDPEPSAEDIAVTNRLKQAGEILGVPVLDHLVICGDEFRSLKECQLL